MNIEKEIKKYLKSESGKLPWPVGRNAKISERAERVWRLLPQWQRLLISKFNPFKIDRMNGLLNLNREGIPYAVLKEISGLSERTIDNNLGRMKRELNTKLQ